MDPETLNIDILAIVSAHPARQPASQSACLSACQPARQPARPHASQTTRPSTHQPFNHVATEGFWINDF